MRSSGLISGLSSLSCGGVRAWPELLLEVGTMVTITPAGHTISLLGHNGERWVSSLIYSVLSTAHGVSLWRLRLDPSALSSLIVPELLGLHLIPFTPRTPHSIQGTLKKVCVLPCRAGVSGTPLQRSLMTTIWLPEPIGSTVGRIDGRQGMQCITVYNHHYLSDQQKLLTMVIWTALYIKQ